MFAEPAKSIAVPVTINSTTPSGKVIVDTFQVGFSTTASSLIEHYFQNGMIPDRNFSLFEVRQHERKRFVRKCMFDELVMVLLFNWHLSSHQYSLVLRKEVPSIYVDLRKELCRTLPLESLLQRQMVIQTAEDDAINAVGKRVDHQKKLLIKRMQELNARDYSSTH
ncbi:hypothetical protein HDV03_005383 [Kappamyces sp. JEL0829]|nr:hypothetical protein HDV03_005383 [Kappamyces sp. JEL0829]